MMFNAACPEVRPYPGSNLVGPDVPAGRKIHFLTAHNISPTANPTNPIPVTKGFTLEE